MRLFFPSLYVASITGTSALQRWAEGDNQPAQGLRAHQSARTPPAQRVLEERILEAQGRRRAAVDPDARRDQEQLEMVGLLGEREMRAEASTASVYEGGAALSGDDGQSDGSPGGEVEFVDDGSGCERDSVDLYDFESGVLPGSTYWGDYCESRSPEYLPGDPSWEWGVTGTGCSSESSSCARAENISLPACEEGAVVSAFTQLTNDNFTTTSDGILSFDMRCDLPSAGSYCGFFLSTDGDGTVGNASYSGPTILDWEDDANPIRFNITANTRYKWSWAFSKFNGAEATGTNGSMSFDNVRFTPLVCEPTDAPSKTPTMSPTTGAPSTSPTTSAPTTKAPTTAPTVDPPHKHPHWYWAFDHLNQIFWRAVGNPH